MTGPHATGRADGDRMTKGILGWAAAVAFGVVALFFAAIWASFEQAAKERDERTALSVRMVERSVTRTLESAEMAMVGVADEVRIGLAAGSFDRLRPHLNEVIRFAPHIRQVLLARGSEVLIDSNGEDGGVLDLGRLDFQEISAGRLSQGLKIGRPVASRFLPRADETGSVSNASPIIPVALDVGEEEREGGPPLMIIAALNSAYFTGLFDDLRLGDGGAFVMGRLDDTALLASRNTPPMAASFAAMASAGVDGSFHDEGGFARAVRLSSRYPVGVALFVSHRDTLRDWAWRNRVMIMILGVATLSIVAASALLMKGAMRQTRLADQVRLLSLAVEQSPVIAVITDADGAIDYINPAFTEKFGYTLDEVTGCNPRVLNCGRTPKETYADLWETIRAGRSWSGEFLNQAKDGRVICVTSTISAVRDASGRLTHYIGLMQDVTEAKRAEQERALLIQRLGLANADLQRFAEISAHHLQEPSRRLVSFAQRLKKSLAGRLDDDQESSESLGFIEEQAGRLRNLLRDIEIYLAATDVIGGGEASDADVVLAGSLRRHETTLKTIGAEIVITPLPPAAIDESNLSEVFAILIDNAVRFRRADRPLRIRVSGKKTAGGMVRYRIADNGRGIPIEYRERVFQVFERLHPGAGDANTGIGLAVVRRIATNADGRVWIEDGDDGGAAIVIELHSPQES